MEFLNAIWQWTLHLGGWQSPLTLAVVTAGIACIIIGRRLGRSTMDETGMGAPIIRTIGMVIAYAAGVVLSLYALMCIAAVFWPLFH